MILFKKLMGIDSGAMREIGDNSNVEWNYHEIVYKTGYIGYENGQKEDIQDIKESAKQVIGLPLIHVPQSEIDQSKTEESR